jgi:hypothetical protein
MNDIIGAETGSLSNTASDGTVMKVNEDRGNENIYL